MTAELDTQASEALRAMARRVAAARRETREVVAQHAETFAHLYAERDKAEHAKHKAWLRTRLGRWFTGRAYTLGLISGSCWIGSATCDGCVKLYWRGRRSYILGASRGWWECLLRYRHLRAELDDGSRLCAKCAPCPTCSSADPRHDSWACENAGAES